MDFSSSNRINIFEIYSKYCEIISSNEYASSKEQLALLSKSVESRGQTRNIIFDDLSKLMAHLEFTVDSLQFTVFYDFVFFFCRENGQKSISVSRAIAAWRLVFAGRFRLLNQWCDFVEKHQRHNISEDTWQQVLVFSRCVNEDLEGYDPKGAFPVLIDDFVEYMYRITQSNSHSSMEDKFSPKYCETDTPPCISAILPGLTALLGSKRKSPTRTGRHAVEASSSPFSKSKRCRRSACEQALWETSTCANTTGSTCDSMEMSRHHPLGCSNDSACGMVQSLSLIDSSVQATPMQFD